MPRFIYLNCPRCSEEIGRQNNRVEYKLHNDLGCLEYSCEKGHQNYVIVQNFDFEILLSMAIESMNDEYYSDAIFNFASALERCFEFVIELLFFEKGIDEKEYEKFWKNLENNSEAQFGAFIALYLSRLGLIFKRNNDMSALRNRIVHKGRIPNEKEANIYGEYIVNTIYDIVESIALNIDKKVFSDFTLNKLHNKCKDIEFDKNASMTTLSMPCISFRTATEEDIKYEQRLSEYIKKNQAHWTEMAFKANEIGKVLYLNKKDELVLKDQSDPFVRNSNEKYIGRQTLEDMMISHARMKNHYVMAESGYDKSIEIKKLKNKFVK
jgi:hypothetical protein